MKKILALYYSQSGDTIRCVESLLKKLDRSVIEIYKESIIPKVEYPYPWNINRFLDVFPECVNEEPPEINSLKIDLNINFDLVILAYQVWFLAPSLPVQGFLKSEQAKLLKGKKVITLISCRQMWYSAAEMINQKLQEIGANHIGNIVITHQGPPLTTFITTPVLLLTGEKKKLLGILPAGGFAEQEINNLDRFGQQIAKNLSGLGSTDCQSMFSTLNQPKINQSYLIAEKIGKHLYKPWAILARRFGIQGSWQRLPIIYLFACHLILLLPVVLLLSAIINILFTPLLEKRTKTIISTNPK